MSSVITKMEFNVLFKLYVFLLIIIVLAKRASLQNDTDTFVSSKSSDSTDDYEYEVQENVNETIFLKTKTGCDSQVAECGPCEVCLNNQCLWFVLDYIFNDDCTLINYCNTNQLCGDNQCDPSFGTYVCRCPLKRFGNHCQYEAKTEGEKVISRVTVLYTPHLPALDTMKVMVAWYDNSPGFGNTKVLFTTQSQAGSFMNRITFDRFRFNLRTNPFIHCLMNFELRFRRFCGIFPNEKLFTVLQFSAEYPYMEKVSKNHKRIRPRNQNFGHSLEFNIKIITSVAEKVQEVYDSHHKAVVYYPHQTVYNNKCFPKKIIPKKPCIVDRRLLNDDVQTARKDTIDLTPVMNSEELNEENFDESKIPIYSLTSSDQLKIQPYTLDPGRYRVKITVKSNLQSGTSMEEGTNFIYCWLEMNRSPLIANIEGGALRTVYAYDDLVLNASNSLDPDQPPSRQQHLFFHFQCNETDDFCKPFSTKIPEYVIKAPLRAGKSFLFTLKVYAFNSIPAYYNQIIVTTDIPYASFFVLCLKNCGRTNGVINPSKSIYLLANAKNPEDYEFDWTYSFTGSEKNESRPIREIESIETFPYVSIIRANSLVEGKSYTFTVSRMKPVGEASISVITGKRPTIICEIHPRSGYRLQTAFRISCTQTSPEPVMFTFFSRDHMKNTLPIFLGHNEQGKLENINLYYTNVYIIAMTKEGCHNTVMLKVKLDTPEWLSDGQTAWEKLGIGLYQSNLNIWSKNNTGLLNNFLYMILHFEKLGVYSAIGWDYLMYIDKADYQSVRPESPYEVMRLLSILTKIIVLEEVPNISGGYDSIVMNVANTISDMITCFYRFDTFFQKDVMVTSSLVGLLANSLFRCQIAFLDSLVDSDATMKGIMDLNDEPMTGLNPIFGSAMLEAAAGIRVYGNLKTLTNLMAHSVLMFLKAMSLRLLPMEVPFYLIHNNYSVYVTVDSPRYYVLFERIPVDSNSSFVKLDAALGQELHQISQNINLEIFVMDRNPFWWDQGESTSIDTQLIYIRMAKVVNSKVTWRYINMLINPMNIYLRVKEWKSLDVSGEASLPQDSSHHHEKDLSVIVYQITPQFAGNGKLFVSFTEILPIPSLRVILTQEIRPDYKLMMEKGRNIVNPKSELALPYTVEKENVFLYIGILPGPKYSQGEIVKFSFKVSIIRCLIRSRHSIWVASRCIVAYNTNATMVHCRCFMISFVGAEISIPTLHMSVLQNIAFSMMVTDNFLPPLCAIIILFLFTIMFFWTRYREKYEHARDNIIVLEDNFPGEECAYLVGVYTGCQFFSGTSSRVGIRLIGSSMSSRAHALQCSRKKTLQTYSDDWFLLFTAEHLGELKTLQIWMDYTGRSPSWYCRKIVVYDCTVQKTYLFRLGVWFYVDHVSHLVELYMLPHPPRPHPLYPLLMDNLVWNFQERHDFIAMIYHHSRSFVSSTEKVAVFWTTFSFVAFLLMFYYKYDGGTEDYYAYRFHLRDLLIASVAYVPAVFVSTAAQLLFRQKIKLHTRRKYVWNAVVKGLQQLEHNYYEKATRNSGHKGRNDNGNMSGMSGDNADDNEFKKTETVYKSQQLPLSIFDESLGHVQVQKNQLYIVWAVVLAALGLFCFTIVVEGMAMGRVKSYVWLTAMVVATVVGHLVLSPLYIIIRTSVETFFSKRQCDEPAIEVNPRLGTRQHLLGDKEYLDKLRVLRAGPEYRPLRHYQILKRKSRAERRLFWKLLLEFLFILLVFNLVFFNTMYWWLDSDFYTSQHLKNLIEKDAIEVTRSRSLNGFFKSMLSSVFSTTVWYNKEPISVPGDKYEASGWVADYTARMIGVVQLRQMRVITVNCLPKLLRDLFPNWMCVPILTEQTLDKNDYSIGWNIPSEEVSKTLTSPWIYRSSTVKSIVHYGKDGTHYTTGGYILNLGHDRVGSLKILGKMDDASWITTVTRVVFINCRVFNPNTRKLSVVSACLQIRPTTGIDHYVQVLSLPADNEETIHYKLLCGLLSVVPIVYVTILLISLVQNGTSFFLSFWNYLDFTIVCLFAFCLYCSVADAVHMKFSLQGKLDMGQKDFFTNVRLGYHSRIYKSVYILLVTCCSVRLFKHLVNTLRMVPVLRTLRAASVPIYKIVILVLPILYLQFNVIGGLLFNPQLAVDRFPLVNKISLDNYAKRFIFPERKLVPFLYCQFCTIVIVLFAILITYHYRIERNRLTPRNDDRDIVQVLRRRISKQKK